MKFRIILEPGMLRRDYPLNPVANRPQIERAIRERLGAAADVLGEPLVGQFAGMRRLRVGDWRIIYDIDADNNVTIHTIKIRRDAYKKR